MMEDVSDDVLLYLLYFLANAGVLQLSGTCERLRRVLLLDRPVALLAPHDATARNISRVFKLPHSLTINRDSYHGFSTIMQIAMLQTVQYLHLASCTHMSEGDLIFVVTALMRSLAVFTVSFPSGYGILEGPLNGLALASSLVCLKLSEVSIPMCVIRELVRYHKLEHLELSAYNSHQNFLVEQVAEHCPLRCLALDASSDMKLSSEAANALATCGSLTELRLCACELSVPTESSSVPAFAGLKTLFLDCYTVLPDWLPGLLHHLEDLTLGDGGVMQGGRMTLDDGGEMQGGRMTLDIPFTSPLHTICYYDCPFTTDATAAHLCQIKSLKRVVVGEGTPCSALSREMLAHLDLQTDVLRKDLPQCCSF